MISHVQCDSEYESEYEVIQQEEQFNLQETVPSKISTSRFGAKAEESSVQRLSDEKLSPEAVIALTRDHKGRRDPDELLQGMLAAWPIVLIVLSVFFAAVFVLSVIGHIICQLMFGKDYHKEQKWTSLVERIY